MAAEGVIYRHTVEAFLERVVLRRQLLTSAVLRARGLWPARDLPLAQWVALLEEVAGLLAPAAPRDEALEQVGRELIRGYAETLVGRSVQLVARLLGPQRALLRLSDSFGTADSTSQVSARAEGPRQVRIEFGDDAGTPTYLEGIFRQLLEALGVGTVRIARQREASGHTVFLVSW